MESKDPKAQALSTLDMFRQSHLKQTLILMFNWVCAIVTSYALILNMNDLAGDIFVNYILTALAEIPAIFFAYYLMDKFGKLYESCIHL